MSNDDFVFEQPTRPEPGPSSAPANVPACGTSCPLAQIPSQVWKDLLRRPFRKRHPVIFWFLILLVGACLGGTSMLIGDEGLLEDEGRLALVSVTGPIMDVAPTLDWIAKIERNPRVKGVLLRVDSPGGGAAASQELHDALARLAKKMPVVASMGSTAASGALMVSMAARRIFANPSTVTGSIGVRMDIPQVHELMKKLGVGQETLTTAPFKDAASYTHPLSREGREYLAAVLDDMHGQFVDIVATGRAMPRDKAAELANGKIFTGREALRLGLVDELGGREKALAWLAKEADVPASRPLLKRPSNKNWLREALDSRLGLGLEQLLNAGSSLQSPVFLFQM